MKIIFKYLWSVLLVPFLVFLKGDFSVDTYISVNQIEPLAKTRERMIEQVQPATKPILHVKVKAISESGSFTAAGLPAELYDSNYNLIAKSQIVNNRINFSLDKGEDTLANYTVVIPNTADEISFNGNHPSEELQVHESHLID